MRRVLWLTLIISFCSFSIAGADTLILQSGQKIKGHIIQRTELRITVDVKGSTQTYFLGEIASINGKKVEVLPVKTPLVIVNAVKKPVKPAHKHKQTAATPTPAMPRHRRNSPMPQVLSTPDGGIIVVSPQKMVKYDKNLNVIKEVDFYTDTPATK